MFPFLHTSIIVFFASPGELPFLFKLVGASILLGQGLPHLAVLLLLLLLSALLGMALALLYFIGRKYQNACVYRQRIGKTQKANHQYG